MVIIGLKRICGYSVCRKLIDYTEKYCDRHKAIADMEHKKSYRDYKARRMADKSEKKLQEFYNTKEWERLRDLVKVKQLGMDVYEYYTTGEVIAAQTYHHCIELREDWSKGLNVDNIIGLTESNHQTIHRIYNKSEQSKKDTQRMLLVLVEKFYKEFG